MAPRPMHVKAAKPPASQRGQWCCSLERSRNGPQKGLHRDSGMAASKPKAAAKVGSRRRSEAGEGAGGGLPGGLLVAAPVSQAAHSVHVRPHDRLQPLGCGGVLGVEFQGGLEKLAGGGGVGPLLRLPHPQPRQRLRLHVPLLRAAHLEVVPRLVAVQAVHVPHDTAQAEVVLRQLPLRHRRPQLRRHLYRQLQVLLRRRQVAVLKGDPGVFGMGPVFRAPPPQQRLAQNLLILPLGFGPLPPLQ
mmetsp:Transcript_3540/g.10273  ORF Transcript_3540/g.10273 Transcript_3540/m.10273 type:complete len:245 (+) Transcript_3540:570-1304(+)